MIHLGRRAHILALDLTGVVHDIGIIRFTDQLIIPMRRLASAHTRVDLAIQATSGMEFTVKRPCQAEQLFGDNRSPLVTTFLWDSVHNIRPALAAIRPCGLDAPTVLGLNTAIK